MIKRILLCDRAVFSRDLPSLESYLRYEIDLANSVDAAQKLIDANAKRYLAMIVEPADLIGDIRNVRPMLSLARTQQGLYVINHSSFPEEYSSGFLRLIQGTHYDIYVEKGPRSYAMVGGLVDARA